jgi:hypothetical protein
MSHITFQKKYPLPRACDANPAVHVEAIVGVPVAGHPLAEHFRVCGAGHLTEDAAAETVAKMNAAAQRIEIVKEATGCKVVVDGRYVAGDFNFKEDYSDAAAGELRVAECAVRHAIALSQGQQPSDMGLPRKDKGLALES